MMRRLIHFLLLVLVISSCTQDEPETVLPLTEQKLLNVTYGDHARNSMDVFLPANRTSESPLILLIHGGAWMGGAKEDLQALQLSLLTKNIASVSMNYRFVDENTHVADEINDIREALQTIQDKAENWNLPRSGYFIGGHSAGGHLALLYAHKYDRGDILKGVVSAAGPTVFDKPFLDAMRSMWGGQQLIRNLSGVDYDPAKPIPAEILNISPLNQLSDMPTLLIHGTNDWVVPYSHSVRFEEAMKVKGYDAELYTLQGVDHSLGFQSATAIADIVNRVANWMEKHK